MEENTIWHKLSNIDKRIIYVVMLFAVMIPLLKPLGLPLVYQREVIDTLAVIRSFPAGTIAYMGCEVDVSNSAELRPMMIALAKVMFELEHKIIIGGFWTDGCNLAAIWLGPVLDSMGAVYGEHYVILGHRSSPTTILDTARIDWIDAYSDRDINNMKLSEMKVMEGLAKASDLGYACIMNPGSPGTATYTTAWTATGTMSMILDFCTSGMYISAGANYQAGLTKGLVGGLNGAAQFEMLVNHPDKAVRSMDAQAFGHVAVIVFLIIGNVGYLNIKKLEREAKGE
ncbi:MAG: hypothetical protein FWF06_07530 [Symbiobacteriaceae bacterium]|nr:hypothetical protein [Symbiobacteriaceae bacterium]